MGERAAGRVAAVIGDPARHSRSPAIHNAAFAATGIDWAFTAFEVPAGGGAAALDVMRVLGLAGLSVTMPLKAEAAEAADVRDDVVQVLGAANCIVPLGDGRLRAANTDAAGFLAGLKADAGISAEGLRVALLGAGGAARAVALALAAAGAAEVAVINRTPARAEAAAAAANATVRPPQAARTGDVDEAGRTSEAGETGQTGGSSELSDEFGAGQTGQSGDVGETGRISETAESGRAGVGRVGSLDDIGGADLVVNATSVGMGAHASRSAMPCDPTLLRPGQVAVDLIYEPLETAWLAALRQRGVEAHNGLSMLVHQAAAAFELWTGVEAPLEVMRRAALR